VLGQRSKVKVMLFRRLGLKGDLKLMERPRKHSECVCVCVCPVYVQERGGGERKKEK